MSPSVLRQSDDLTPTLPASWYSDPEVLRREQALIFARSWHYVGHAGELPRAGQFRATLLGRVPVVLVRDDARVLRAFLNVCRHRGALVCDGTGARATLQCPYHAWTYGLDGRLLQAPRLAAEGVSETRELGLVELQLQSWGPFLFVNPHRDAAPLREMLGDVPERIARAGIDVDSLRFLERSESELAANWKIVVENYLECYHCPVAHPGFSRALDVSVDAYWLEANASRMSQGCPPRASAGGEVRAAEFHLLFPGTFVNVYPGRANLSIGPLWPCAPERTRRFLDYFVAPDADPSWVEELQALDEQVGKEDRALVESVHAGLASGLLDSGKLLPESERLIAHFQALVRAALASRS